MIFWCRLPLQFPAASDHTETGLCPYCNHQRTCISAGNHWKRLFASSWGTPDSWHHWHCRCTRRGMGLPYHESHSTGCNPHSTQTPQIHSSIFRNLNHTVFIMPGKTLSSGYKKRRLWHFAPLQCLHRCLGNTKNTWSAINSDSLNNPKRERERESRFLTAHQHKAGHSVPFEINIKANGTIRWTKGT